MISRTFRVSPNAATVGFDNLMTGASMLRGVKPEMQIEIDSQAYQVGGLVGQPNYAYLLDEWLDDLKAVPEAFQFTGYQVDKIKERFGWKRKRYNTAEDALESNIQLSWIQGWAN
ncbi:MAG: hypothetical protein GY869_15910 [Planctomycetes bacterium]|nr:hypothetical protein [Planctomycetota bacterium]